jgi:hypothetical protein
MLWALLCMWRLQMEARTSEYTHDGAFLEAGIVDGETTWIC